MTQAPGMLFAPPLPPLRLEAGREAVLGRGDDCELRLESGGASRRHAAVRTAPDGGCWVRDLGSTNGTFVNGERVEGERVLRPGDRIEIGEASVTFYRMDPAMAATKPPLSAGGGERTILMQAPAPRATALGGRLEEIPTFAVLQMLEMGGKTGMLTFEGEGEKVRIWLLGGKPVHAEGEKTRGEEAAFAGLRLQHGSFRFDTGAQPPETTLAATLTELLLEAARLGDEEER